jgi:hypothetical protein
MAFAKDTSSYTATRHQREVGTGYFDQILMTVSEGKASPIALEHSTEAASVKACADLASRPEFISGRRVSFAR